MAQGHERAFGGGCSQTVKDAAAFISSHINSLSIARYGYSNNCWLLLDAGPAETAR